MQVSLQDIGALFGGIAALYGAFRGMPLLANRMKLIRERDHALDISRESREAAEAYKLSSDGWQKAVAQFSVQIQELATEVRTLRSQLASAVVYITDLHIYMRGGGALPPIPAELRAAIEEVLNQRSPSESLQDHAGSFNAQKEL